MKYYRYERRNVYGATHCNCCNRISEIGASWDYDSVYFEVNDEGNVIWESIDMGQFADEVYELAQYIDVDEEEYYDTVETDMCQSCIKEKVHETNKYMVVTHGLSAFDKAVTDLSDIDSKLSHMLGEPDTEYCGCTTRHCGPVGVEVQALVSHHFDHDCWSMYNGGIRIYGHENKYSDHDELWFSHIKRINNLWVKSWYWNKLDSANRSYLEEMANDYNTVIKVIPAET